MICRCDCGTERAVSTVSLRRGVSQSCGCLRGELGLARTEWIERGIESTKRLSIDGTHVPSIRPGRKVNSNTITGVTGVAVHPMGYVAYINFKGKRYYLGRYPTIEDAAAVRKQAEKEIYGPFLAWYDEHIKNKPPSQ